VPSRALIATLFLLAACSHTAPAQKAAEPEVVLRASSGQELRVKVELARNPEERARGLMDRASLLPNHGMLFIFEAPAVQKFWMKNTYIPLDMLFIATWRASPEAPEQKRVIFVEENAEPLTLSPRGPDTPCQYVLEMAGGWARAHGVGPGVDVRFEGIH
jgi:hypothetical protein